MKKIPTDNHIRNLLDGVEPGLLSSVFTDCFTALKQSGDMDTFRIKLGRNNNDLLIALDGTQYFSSDAVTCKNCLRKQKDGNTIYSHSMVTPTVVAPGNTKVISLAPEFITPQDGDTKQDCEIKASKRLLAANEKTYKALEVTLLGDDLYSHEPFCREILAKECNFILVCKPESHKTVYEWIKGITREKSVDRFDGKSHQIYTYSYVEKVPLKDSDTSLLVNFVELTVKDRKSGRQLYHNAWVTNHPLLGKTEQETEIILNTIVDCGRARWKIENENNNTLKRQGYNLEHNFGHGKKYLASVLAVMNILAFLFHTMLELMDEKYQLLRKMAGSRKTLFNDMRAMLKHVLFTSFNSMLAFMIESLQRPYTLEELRFPV